MAEVVIIDSKFHKLEGRVEVEIYVSGQIRYENNNSKSGNGTVMLQKIIASKIDEGFVLISQSSAVNKQGDICSTYTLVQRWDDLIKL
jgi:hypothetical protein